MKLNVSQSEPLGVAPGQFDHVLGHVDAHHTALCTYRFGCDEAVNAAAAAKIHNGLPGPKHFNRVGVAAACGRG